jgi:ubiquinone/menaquinone biosynthesis C-methylase UbiE
MEAFVNILACGACAHAHAGLSNPTMERVPEPELMTSAEQVDAYARGDFEAPHQRFIELLRQRLPALGESGEALDIGCGPGDITCRFARAFPGWQVHGVDGSVPMLELARTAARESDLSRRVCFQLCYLHGGEAPIGSYDLLFSNSLLHHLADPLVLWEAVRRWSRAGAAVFVMDLLRPGSESAARNLVEQYAIGEPEVLRRDFFNSLCAGYRPEELREQLRHSGLGHLTPEVVSDRHWLVAG